MINVSSFLLRPSLQIVVIIHGQSALYEVIPIIKPCSCSVGLMNDVPYEEVEDKKNVDSALCTVTSVPWHWPLMRLGGRDVELLCNLIILIIM